MPFFNVFLRTLGFLIGITVFIILLNLLFYILPEEKENFDFVEGNKESNNIIAILDLNGPIINNFNQSLVGDLFEYITPNRVKNYLSNLKKIKTNILIIKINSPGGTVTATASLEKIINDFKALLRSNRLRMKLQTNYIKCIMRYTNNCIIICFNKLFNIKLFHCIIITIKNTNSSLF